MAETAAIVSGIAYVKRELDHIDAQIREHQVSAANMQKRIAASVEKKKDLTLKIEEVESELLVMQTQHQNVMTIFDYRKGLWRSEVEEMEGLQVVQHVHWYLKLGALSQQNP
jgi:chromosome segregation ATPase